MRIILDCEPEYAERALALVLRERSCMERLGLRAGWGYWSSADPSVSFWVAKTKSGFSVHARPANPSVSA